ncbi:hypothetical protein [Streptomyces fuscigenes]|uniref:hypothetical protein n=1 Tax=Streptomyces fuscigenes TaxID=1528880 RepID=UPI001F245B4D|nr:hypothetical protein [Streptomyces fuscigenes]MCF3961366.1 hypothetical protein [Streptomyces fuscigenes]
MFRRREGVPFSFLAEAEADRFDSNVEPPPKQRAGRGELMGRALIGLVIAGAFAGSLLFGMPALESNPTLHHVQQSEASQHR